MGMCQGGFCTYRIMQLVARETGLALEAITKRGRGSELVSGRIGPARSAAAGREGT